MVRLLLVGVNHRSAPLAVREQFAVEAAVPVLEKLVAGDEIEEAVLISTCNRVEIAVSTQQLEAARHRLERCFHSELGSGLAQSGVAWRAEFLYEHVDAEAARHLFRVAASLDSMVIGEPQILGQVKDAFRLATDHRTCGPILSRLFEAAFTAAKRVRSETRIAERPVSIARVAVDLAAQIFESFADKAVLLIGAGEMTELALAALRQAGLARLAVANRRREHAFELAKRFNASAHLLADLPELLPAADIVITSVAGSDWMLRASQVSEAQRLRHGRPLFVIDMGVPRNVDPAVNRLADVYLYDIDDLGRQVERNAAERSVEGERAEAIVREEAQRFLGWLFALRAVPTIRDLRARAEEMRAAELQKSAVRLALTPEQFLGVEALTHTLVNKILHAPLSRLRSALESEAGAAQLEAARSLFALDVEASSENGAEGALDPSPDDS